MSYVKLWEISHHVSNLLIPHRLRHLLQDHLNYQKSTDNVKFIHELILLNQLLLQRMGVQLEIIKILLMMLLNGGGNVMVNIEELQLNVLLLSRLHVLLDLPQVMESA